MANSIDIKVPDIGDFDKVPVIEVLVAEGDEVAVDDSLITLESDKATMEVPASHAGKITSMKVAVGDEVAEGDVIAVVEASDSESDEQTSESAEQTGDDESEQQSADQNEAGSQPDDAEQETQPNQQPAEQHSEDDDGKDEAKDDGDRQKTTGTGSAVASGATSPSGDSHASPSVRKLARKLEIDLSTVKASGRKGRITEDDLHAHLKGRMSDSNGQSAGISIAPARNIDFSKFGDVEEQPLSRIKKISGAHLHRNWVTIPHVTQHDHADITQLEAFRKEHDAELREQGTRLTMIVFLIKACVAGLKRFPQFNASLSSDGEALILKKYFHIGIAVDTEDGLVVPVIRNCEQKGLLELAHELTDLSSRAREGKLKPAEMQGGCLSISSLGGIGGTAFTPIVNGPEVAILGVSRAAMQPVWDGEAFQPKLMLPLSLSYDHRVIDGADAARFARFLVSRLEDFRRVVL